MIDKEIKKVTIEDVYAHMGDNLTNEEIKKIREAFEFACKKHEGMVRLTKEPFINHPLNVALILADLHVDAITIEAALLHETLNNSNTTKEELEENFGSTIASIVDSVTKINKLELPDDSENSAIYLRKVLVGLAEDVRVLFIKLADRLHNMRTNWAVNPNKQKKKASETMSVLVPIAHRLGINSIKSELEDLCLRYTKPDVYEDILDHLNKSYEELHVVLDDMEDCISDILIEHGIHFHIKSRVKSVYSIYNKLNNGHTWNNIYDILALRIIVDKVSDCYTAIGLIHAKYRPMPNRFKDYIAMPKENMYQSLHTGVFGSDGHVFEIQIRTPEMDELAEKGIASHWSYKEKGTKKIQNLMEQKLEIFRNAIEAETEGSSELINVKEDFLGECIYVFTPKGDVVELPKGSTPIDFAYRIHSEVGNKTVSAIVNEHIVPLDYVLQDNDIIKIKTNPTSTPSKTWLNFVKTSHARGKIKSYFSRQEHDIYLEKGKMILEKEIRKRKLSISETLNSENVKKICSNLNLQDLEDIYFSVGVLRHTASNIIAATNEKNEKVDILIEKMPKATPIKINRKSDVLVNGASDILVSLAGCCKPVKNDLIIGYITKGEGVKVHRSTCPNISDLKERLIEVSWNPLTESVFYTNIEVRVSNDKNYLLDIISKATSKNIYISEIKTKELEKENVYELTIKVNNKEEVDNFIAVLENCSFVIEGKRI